ncbi:hypothetical protein PHISCL_05365 [Aspergillus sclerotialis]|uniref:Uncharacterized protein n=1 Tax=Aspergillus sclerotialis TaxID=2070753 RepID=A0A3A2ZZ29_9EURO|nr:hypothetical protein PHISCL_05365 [Aspergillus sclerotialis]
MATFVLLWSYVINRYVRRLKAMGETVALERQFEYDAPYAMLREHRNLLYGKEQTRLRTAARLVEDLIDAMAVRTLGWKTYPISANSGPRRYVPA